MHVHIYIYVYAICTYTFINIYICNIFVCTWYRHVYTASQPHFTSHQAQSALQCLLVSAQRRLSSLRAASFLSSVFSTDRPPRRGLPRPNCHSHRFTVNSYTLLPHRPSAASVSQVPAGKTDLLCWLY
jgi:hypothetical protein